MLLALLALLSSSPSEPRGLPDAAVSVQPLAEAARRYPVGPPPPDWPSGRVGRVVTAPDWADYHIYPPAAYGLDEQGRVRVAMRVGTDGRPLACRVTRSSGYVELDDGTCDLTMTMRFAPGAGPPAEAFYSVQLRWELTDPIPLAPARAVVQLDLAGGHVVACRLQPGDVPAGWARDLCPLFTNRTGYFLGPAGTRARHASIVVQLRPTGDAAPLPPPPAGRLVAGSRTEFALTADGDFTDCRTIAHGFGTTINIYWGNCSPALLALWFGPPEAPDAPHGGTLELSVYVER
jgi:TonB family protein